MESVGQDGDGKWFALVSGATDDTLNGYHEIEVGVDGAVAEITLDNDSLAGTPPTPTSYEAKTRTDTATVDFSDVDLDDLATGGEISRVVKDKDGAYFVQVTGADNETGNGFYSATVDLDGTVEVDSFEATADIVGAPTGVNLEPLDALDEALMQVDELRSELGAVQNRFEDAITNLNTNETNLAAARSRIEDADYAVEVANMTRAQILQQAGTSVLAQANQIPQNVLSLLG
ncbi:MAG: hypothetical protein GX771_09395 [Halomonadaceae bacterium]|nr:hypothetical protein [Halomonadaceae bacterium]